MSTRAIYEIDAGELTSPVTFYVHHDGYPEGAAQYFYNMVEASGRSFAAKFIRGNDNAEFTAGDHGDTEYHYKLLASGVLMYSHRRPGDDWGPAVKTDLVTFLNRYTDETFTQVSLSSANHSGIANESMLMRAVTEVEQEFVEMMSCSRIQANPNLKAYAEKMGRIAEALQALDSVWTGAVTYKGKRMMAEYNRQLEDKIAS